MNNNFEEYKVARLTLENIFKYLSTKPFNEVEGLVAALRMSKPILKEEAKEEAKELEAVTKGG